ncbi:MAG: hypothetical protein K8L99_29930 [Anaerolineae bacterium]|nr:hypothetical protein [Anaerolineae bacterium]
MQLYDVYIAAETAKERLEHISSKENNYQLRTVAEINQSRSDFVTRVYKIWNQLKPHRSQN